MNNEAAMEALSNIEGFRNLNQDIETIINKSESIKKTKAEANERDLTPKEKNSFPMKKKNIRASENKFKKNL